MKVGLLTPSGWGNLGDAAIQDATIAAIRRRHPAAEIRGFTLNPQDTLSRHGIEAEPLSGYSIVPGYRVRTDTTASAPASPTTATGPPPPRRRSSRARRSLSQADEWLYRGLCDLRYLRALRPKLASFDLVLASGGGQVDDEWGGAWGHPWTLAKWATLSRAVGVPFRVLSVGLCHLEAVSSRLLARAALRQADYLSFRDEESRLRALEMGLVERARVVPDLGFSHPGLDPRDWVAGDDNVVAVGPMVWKDPRRWACRDGGAHEDYLRRITEFVARLLGDGRRVLLLPGDTADLETARTVRQRLAATGAPLPEIPEIESVEQLLSALQGVGSVVASRLHLVLLAAGLGKPVLPLSYDTKVDALCEELGLLAYRLGIDSARATELGRTLEELEGRREAVCAQLRERVEVFRERLERQYDEVLR